MPFFPKWDNGEMPDDPEQLLEWALDAYNQGIKIGRRQGGKETVTKVEAWVRAKYFHKDTVRGTPEAEAILRIAETLIYELLHGDLGKVPDPKPQGKARLDKEEL